MTLFMHVSLDGFVAGPNGEMDWIQIDEEMFEMAGERTKEADMALYGRVTYEMMEGYWPTAGEKPNASKHDLEHSTWYNQVAKVILSKSMQGQVLPKTAIISDNLLEEITQLKQQPGNEIIIFGSPGASRSLMELDLIDDFWLFVNPILVGTGIPLFANLKDRIKLHLVSSRVLASGVVALHYEKVD